MSDENNADDAVAKAVAEATAGLKAKNDELLGKLKADKAEREAMKAQLDELTAAKDQAESEAATKAGDVEGIKKQLEAKHAKEMEKLQAQLDGEKTVNRKLLVDNGLISALTEAGVAKEYLPAARALIQTSNEIELVDQDGQRIAQVGGSALNEFVSAWAQSDTGKHFVAAPNNAGGGGQGSSSTDAKGKTIPREAWDNLSQSERMAAAKDGAKVVDA